MTPEVIDDLKQFIVTAIDDGTVGMRRDIGTLKSDVADLKQGLADLDIKVDTLIDAVDEDLRAYKKVTNGRLNKLEQTIKP